MENENHPHQKTKSNKLTVSKKRVKNHVSKEANLDENEVLVGSYVMELNDKYICNHTWQ